MTFDLGYCAETLQVEITFLDVGGMAIQAVFLQERPNLLFETYALREGRGNAPQHAECSRGNSRTRSAHCMKSLKSDDLFSSGFECFARLFFRWIDRYDAPGLRAAMRRFISSGETSSMWVEMVQRWPKGSIRVAERSP